MREMARGRVQDYSAKISGGQFNGRVLPRVWKSRDELISKDWKKFSEYTPDNYKAKKLINEIDQGRIVILAEGREGGMTSPGLGGGRGVRMPDKILRHIGIFPVQNVTHDPNSGMSFELGDLIEEITN